MPKPRVDAAGGHRHEACLHLVLEAPTAGQRQRPRTHGRGTLQQLVDRVALDVDIARPWTTVRATLSVRRNPAGPGGPLVLDGAHLELISVALDGQPLDAEVRAGACARHGCHAGAVLAEGVKGALEALGEVMTVQPAGRASSDWNT